jgi:D-alanyl-D-alanine carboxypeptidase/D-alanyl-D-alanine-endopeptidase (penicillin-binding protein 4)
MAPTADRARRHVFRTLAPSLGLVAIALTAPSRHGAVGLAHAQPEPGARPAPEPPARPARSAGPLRAAVDALGERVRKLGGTVGVAVIDVAGGDQLAALQDHKPLNPASVTKVMTAAAALSLLHPNYRYQTALYGDQKGANVGSLVLRGTGDPSLATSDLWDLVRELKEAGVRRVDGDVGVDQRFFDDLYVPPAYEQQPNEWAPFRAPVSALALNENAITLFVRPGAKGSPAAVSFDPPGYVDVEGSVKTVDEGAAQNVGLQLTPAGPRVAAKVSGNVPEGARPLRFTKRADNPALLGGYALKALLAQAGVAVGGDVKPAPESRGRALADHASRPLSALLYELGKQSNNFYAEMVFKSLALEKKGRGAKAEQAAEIVTHFLADVGAWEDGMVIKNGSGLFDANRTTAAAIARLLRAAYRDPTYGSEFVAQLAVGGVDGTLRHRFRGDKVKGAVRAKTGTLEGTAALAGYAFGAPGQSPIAFAIFVNDIAGKVGEARTAIDACVEAMVEYVSARP